MFQVSDTLKFTPQVVILKKNSPKRLININISFSLQTEKAVHKRFIITSSSFNDRMYCSKSLSFV